ncbi:sigma-54-dependent transcriptional regulator [Ottowia sp.]|uniref:sigma-54-dependent transcriptional regulator n=1 Tax=Ottowia sp. TaxID=1898956 RepID=UPI003A8B9BA2
MSTDSPDLSTAHILVIDDEPDLRTLYELALLREGHQVQSAGSVAEARAQLADQVFDLVITDMRLPDGLGLDLLREAAQSRRNERWIMVTAYGSAETAVEALKSGAFDYLTKPVDLKQLRSVVHSALSAPMQSTQPAQPVPVAPGQAPSVSAPSPSSASVASAAPAPQKAAPSLSTDKGTAALERLVGESAVMRNVKQRIAKVARSMAPVLVHGESGTGKELVANAVHACSHRSDGPFVPVNCGAIPENLLEAEFFGARKGSYTGATQDREGFFQAARGGTLFLDEIGDLPLAMQAKLLRAIQERRVRPLGETLEEAVDVRIVSATHKDLAAEVHAGRFRQDLYYRLNVIEIVVPPLRERREDLPALCDALLARIAKETGSSLIEISERRWEKIMASPLEGNVRELENLLHRAIALSEGGGDSGFGSLPSATAAPPGPPETSAQSAPPVIDEGLMDAGSLPDDLTAWLDAQERHVLVRALNETGFNRTAAAARLGLNLRQIRYRMARLGITAPGSGDDQADDAADN